jgi:hypothetical protein
MRLSSKIKATLAMAAMLSTIAAVAWAQNLEVKGNAWFATGGSGSAGIGTNSPLAKFHVIAPGVFGSEATDGTSLAGTVPVVAQMQTGSTAFGIINSHGRQVGAINVDGDGATATSRGYVSFLDKADGVWHTSLSLNKGRVGIGTTAPAGALDVNGDIYRAGLLAISGEAGGWLRINQNGAFPNGTHFPFRANFAGGITTGTWWSVDPGAGNVVVQGRVGIGTTTPALPLDVRGAIGAGNSDVYFTNTGHFHTGFGNTPGYAAIENAADYNTLMILGRAGTSVGRRVDVWDYLQVNGRLRSTTGTPVYVVDPGCASPPPGTLTTSSTCAACMACCTGDSCSNCCSYFSVNNSLAGRLVDP